SKAVTGVDASDFRINGASASGVSGSGSNYTFTFTQPAYGNVAITWLASPGIVDAANGQNIFDPTRAGSTWQYTLLDKVPPVVTAKNPPANANVTNLVMLSVTFSENVMGVDASDLVINGVPALNYGGSGS